MIFKIVPLLFFFILSINHIPIDKKDNKANDNKNHDKDSIYGTDWNKMDRDFDKKQDKVKNKNKKKQNNKEKNKK